MRRTIALGLSVAVYGAAPLAPPTGVNTDKAPAGPVLTNVVTDWQLMLTEALDNVAPGVSNHHHSRLMGLAAEAMLNCLTANKGKLDENVVASYAAHQLLSSWFPQYQSAHFDALLDAYAGRPEVASYPNRQALDDLVLPIVRGLQKREIDSGIANWVQFTAAASTIGVTRADLKVGEGHYQYGVGVFAHVNKLGKNTEMRWQERGHFGTIKPHFKALATYAEGMAPIEVGTPLYDWNLAEVQAYGTSDCTVKGQYNCDSPKFWLHDNSHLPDVYTGIARANLPATTSVTETARFFAMLGLGIFEAANANYGMKWGNLTGTNALWRPKTAIRSGDTFGHSVVAEWNSQIGTPEHPEYPSGHCANSGAGMHALRLALGTNKVSTVIRTDHCDYVDCVTPIPNRAYDTLSAIEADVISARVYGGVHYRSSCWDGNQIGHNAMEAAYEFFYGPVPKIATGDYWGQDTAKLFKAAAKTPVASKVAAAPLKKKGKKGRVH